MSSVDKKRIKGLRRYSQGDNETPFSNMIPFGVDGDLVDSFSGLDFEEELLFGGQKIISFQEDQNQLIITQKYYNQLGECCYSKVSSLTSAPTYQLIEAEEINESGESEEGQLGYIENEEDNFIGDFLGRLQLQITVSLYKGDIDEDENSELLHVKNIDFKNIQISENKVEEVIEESIQGFDLPYEISPEELEEQEEQEP